MRPNAMAWQELRDLWAVVPRFSADDVWPFLLPTETRTITVRKHPASIAWPMLLIAADIAAFALIAAGVSRGGALRLGVLGVLGVLSCLLACWRAFVWWRTFLVVTGGRMIVMSRRWRRRRMVAIPLYEADDMTFVRSLPGRIAGYGTFLIRPADGRRRARAIRFLPYPEQLYIEVCGLLFIGTDGVERQVRDSS
jgi:hypothetical protein